MTTPQKPKIDEPTRRIAERMLNTPPKPHKEMKLGKRKAKASQRWRPPKNEKGPATETGPKS